MFGVWLVVDVLLPANRLGLEEAWEIRGSLPLTGDWHPYGIACLCIASWTSSVFSYPSIKQGSTLLSFQDLIRLGLMDHTCLACIYTLFKGAFFISCILINFISHLLKMDMGVNLESVNMNIHLSFHCEGRYWFPFSSFCQKTDVVRKLILEHDMQIFCSDYVK